MEVDGLKGPKVDGLRKWTVPKCKSGWSEGLKLNLMLPLYRVLADKLQHKLLQLSK